MVGPSLSLAVCDAHPKNYVLILTDAEGSLTRVTSGKCCAVTHTIRAWPLDKIDVGAIVKVHGATSRAPAFALLRRCAGALVLSQDGRVPGTVRARAVAEVLAELERAGCAA